MKKAFFRIDCSNEVGMGHLSRAVTLSKFLVDFEIDLFIWGNAQIPDQWKKNFKNIILLEQPLQLNLNNSYDLGVFDFSTKYTLNSIEELPHFFNTIKIYVSKVLLIDGLGDECLVLKNNKLKVDYLLIPYAGAPNFKERFEKYFQGPSYFVFSEEILNHPKASITDEVKKILITMGGADPFEMSLKVMAALKIIKNSQLNFQVIIGPHFNEVLKRKISNAALEDSRITMSEGGKGIVKDIFVSDLCITASGLTKYEIAKLKKPMIVICHDVNSHQTNQCFEKLGLCEDAGVFSDLSEIELAGKVNDLILNDAKRLSMVESAEKVFHSNLFSEFINIIKE